MSIAGNIVHAWINAPTGKEPIAAFVVSFPPLALLAATHGVGVLVRAQNKAGLAYWAVVALTGAIAVIAFRLSFDALSNLAEQVGISNHLAWLFPLIIDGAIGQATIALLVLARTDRTTPDPGMRTAPGPVHGEEPVRTVSVREVRTETFSAAASRAWLGYRAQSRNKLENSATSTSSSTGCRSLVTALINRSAPATPVQGAHGSSSPPHIRIKAACVQDWTHQQIAEHVDLSKAAVTRTVTAARECTEGGPHTAIS
ncbi:DUF2637 domain-containing protein [Nocardia terpenica]|nr:DUF2637 domain-containing protein [Nocardia terpenica]MBF6060794.1 DUF2637 domain-containing protein [Nocardia terpenica]MBF6104054.1 DUF2637 domain-containing protein [Nocardia terpenica]MBF6118275.1 DUF2637 domain-containing protein [Nocardia terpenica]MBF6156100.1 DUF2637 domain-containing protein [Nocardia terpenica]